MMKMFLRYEQGKEPIEMGALDWRVLLNKAIVLTGMRPKFMYFHPSIYARVVEALSIQGAGRLAEIEFAGVVLGSSDAVPLWVVSVSDGMRLTQMFNYVTGEPIMMSLEG